MADEPIAELGNKTPLQAAHTPSMDAIAREGCSGTLFTLPEAFPTSSDAANMSVLGCDLETEYCGRGPIEAAGQGIAMGPQDFAYRINICNQQDGILQDYSAGQLEQPAAHDIINALNERYGCADVHFHEGVSYRHIMMLKGPRLTWEVNTEKPDDNMGHPIHEHLPTAGSSHSAATVDLLHKIITEAPALLASLPATQRLKSEGKTIPNALWPWNGGRLRKVRTLHERYGITSAVVSAVDVVNGLGIILGMDVIPVKGATGYIDTNWEGKADATIEAIKTHDFVYLHVEGIDEVSHERDLAKKLQGIEDFDARCMARVMAAVGPDVNLAVLPDHPVPIASGKHTRTPVPVSVRMAGRTPDSVRVYSESDSPNGSLGAMEKDGLTKLLFT